MNAKSDLGKCRWPLNFGLLQMLHWVEYWKAMAIGYSDGWF